MAKTNAERFILTHEKVKARAIYRIFSEQKALFASILEENEGKKISRPWEVKTDADDLIDPYLDQISGDIPEYLVTVLPNIMTEGGKGSIKKYKKLLPEDYSFAFDIETSPASNYLRDLEDLYLSTKDGSILKTTRDRLRDLMAKGIDDGKSYGQIAKEIMEVDPWVFSKARAKLIAVNEVGRGYGWGNHEPAVELQRQGFELAKKWATSKDELVRPRHTKNEADGFIPIDKEFSGTGDQFGPSTKEINCRCTSTHKIVALKGIAGRIVFKGTETAEEIKQLLDKNVRKV